MGRKGLVVEGIDGEGRILAELDLADIRFIDFGQNLLGRRVGNAHDDRRVAVALDGHGADSLRFADDDAVHGRRDDRFGNVRFGFRQSTDGSVIVEFRRIQGLFGAGTEVIELLGPVVFDFGVGDLILGLVAFGFIIFAVEDGYGLAGCDPVIFFDQDLADAGRDLRRDFDGIDRADGPVAETVERRSLRTTSAVSMALDCFAACWDS